MEQNKTICAEMEIELAELLLDPQAASATVKAHVETCAACRRELEELRATMSAMDAWDVPEPNPYFMTRFEARFREEKAKPTTWLERLRARFAYGPQMHTRPVAALTLAIVILLGGGTYLDVYWQKPTTPPPQTAYVHDLQTLDDNAQLLDELDTIGDEN